MPTNAQQEFYFHADATSIGGYLDSPKGPVLIPTPSSVALSSAGGLAENQTKDFAFESGIKVGSASTLATGQPVQGGWTERVVSVVEGLDLFGVVTADSLVAQMFIEQPAGGGPRKVTFAGSNVTNLRIDGKPVTIDFEGSLVPTQTRTIDAYNRDATFTPDVAWPALTDLALRQNAALLANKALPAWASHRYGFISGAQSNSGGYTLCSLVNQIGAVSGGQTFGHCIELPDFGRVCLAEIVVLPYSAQLTLLRAELTGKQCGRTVTCMITTNGTTWPPN